MSYYNVIFTILPPLVIGIFDQYVSARMLDRYPQLYQLGQQNYFFTPQTFFYWVGNAFYHSVVSIEMFSTRSSLNQQVLFFFSYAVYYGDMISNDGKASGLWVWGTTLYMGVLLTVLGKAALISKYVSNPLCAHLLTCQRLDKIHSCSYPRFLCFQYGRLASVRHCRSSHRLLEAI
jgi:phospholipid-transporting ATPase